MRLRFLAAFAAVLFSSSIAKADTFNYEFSSNVFNDAFTYISPTLFTADAQFQADTCSINSIARSCTVSLVLSNNALNIGYSIGSLMGGSAYLSLSPDFFTLGTHTKGQATLTITQLTAVTPEPSSMILLGTGALALVGTARRRFVR